MGYNDHLGHSQLPGVSDSVEQTQRVFKSDLGHEAYDGVRIHKDTDDESHTSYTHKLRPGLVLVKVINGGANDGMYVDPHHADAPVNADVTDAVLLDEWVDLKDKNGDRQNCQAKVLVHGQAVSAQLLWDGTSDATRKAAILAKAKLIRFV